MLTEYEKIKKRDQSKKREKEKTNKQKKEIRAVGKQSGNREVSLKMDRRKVFWIYL